MKMQTELENIKKYENHMGYSNLYNLIDKTTSKYITECSDEELLLLKNEADRQYLFFKNMQITTKLLCNSVYGGLGTPSLRYFNHVVADDITAEGRNACQLMENSTNQYFQSKWHKDIEWVSKLRQQFPEFFVNLGCDEMPLQIHEDIIQYADTDSNYLHFSPIFKSLKLDPQKLRSKEVTDFIEYFMKEKMDPFYDTTLTNYIEGRNGENFMIFELEAIGGFGIWCGKKKYVFAKLWADGKYVAAKGDLKVVGLEIRQKSASKIVKKIMKTFVNTIFHKRGKIDSNEFFSMCNSVKRGLQNATFDELSKSTKLNKYDEYVICDLPGKVELAPKCPIAVRAAANHNALIQQYRLENTYPILKNDMFIKYYYDENGEPFAYSAEYGCPEEHAPKISVDMQLEKLIFAPVKRLVSGLIDGNLDNMGDDKIQSGFKSLLSQFA